MQCISTLKLSVESFRGAVIVGLSGVHRMIDPPV
jgi:hypothetical protein